MEITYNITEEDYLNFNMFHVENSKTIIKTLNIQRFSVPIFFLIFSYISSKIGDTPFIVSFIVFLILSILWIIFYPKYFYKHIIRNARKMLKEGKNAGLLGKHHMNMTEDGIEETTSNGGTKVNWSGIEQFKEDHYYLYLYNSSVSAYIIPKRDLNNVEEVRMYIKSKIINWKTT